MQSKLGIQKGKELHRHLNFQFVIKFSKLRISDEPITPKSFKHGKTKDEEEIALQPVKLKGSELHLFTILKI